MILHEWARQWGIPDDAIRDLKRALGIYPQPEVIPQTVYSEEALTKQIRLVEAGRGNVLWRNNVGAMQDADGRVIRYGLANDSRGMNKRIKSSDLIGITPIVIEPIHVGTVVGIFTGIEVKRPGWRYTGTDREKAQRRFLELVISKGGIARFANSIDESVTTD